MLGTHKAAILAITMKTTEKDPVMPDSTDNQLAAIKRILTLTRIHWNIGDEPAKPRTSSARRRIPALNGLHGLRELMQRSWYAAEARK